MKQKIKYCIYIYIAVNQRINIFRQNVLIAESFSMHDATINMCRCGRYQRQNSAIVHGPGHSKMCEKVSKVPGAWWPVVSRAGL